jgi:hypothetical protein
MNLSNEEYFRFINRLDENTLEGIKFLLKENKEKTSSKFLSCENEKELFRIQGQLNSYEEMIKLIERIKEDKIRKKQEFFNN